MFGSKKREAERYKKQCQQELARKNAAQLAESEKFRAALRANTDYSRQVYFDIKKREPGYKTNRITHGVHSIDPEVYLMAEEFRKLYIGLYVEKMREYYNGEFFPYYDGAITNEEFGEFQKLDVTLFNSGPSVPFINSPLAQCFYRGPEREPSKYTLYDVSGFEYKRFVNIQDDETENYFKYIIIPEAERLRMMKRGYDLNATPQNKAWKMPMAMPNRVELFTRKTIEEIFTGVVPRMNWETGRGNLDISSYLSVPSSAYILSQAIQQIEPGKTKVLKGDTYLFDERYNGPLLERMEIELNCLPCPPADQGFPVTPSKTIILRVANEFNHATNRYKISTPISEQDLFNITEALIDDYYAGDDFTKIRKALGNRPSYPPHHDDPYYECCDYNPWEKDDEYFYGHILRPNNAPKTTRQNITLNEIIPKINESIEDIEFE